MDDKPLSKQVAEICKVLEDVGLNQTARVIVESVGDRSIIEHRRWDSDTRQKAQNEGLEALSSTIHSPPEQGPEMAPAHIRSVDELPPLDLGKSPGAGHSEELQPFEVTGTIVREGDRILVPNPGRVPSILLALLRGKEIWEPYAAQKGVPGLSSLVDTLRARLQPAAAHLMDRMRWLACQASRLYGVKISTVSAEQVYRGAYGFVSKAQHEPESWGRAVTYSTTSGIIDPLEGYGTAETLRRIGILPTSGLAARLKRKDAWRVVNFRDGLLHPDFTAPRLYFFDRQATAHSLWGTHDQLAGEDQKDGENRAERYTTLAAQLLCEAVSFRPFRLYAVNSFEPWMARYTRSAPGHALISFRHADSRAIKHGIEMNFDRDQTEARHKWFAGVFRLAKAGSFFLPPDNPLRLVAMLAGDVEATLFDLVKTTALREDIAQRLLRVSTHVTLEGATHESREASAKAFIQALIHSARTLQNGRKAKEADDGTVRFPEVRSR